MLYPNLYTILISPPGVGKTALTKLVHEMWSSLPEHHVAPSSVTSASLVDDLREAKRNIIVAGGKNEEFCSLKICSNELQVLLPAYDAPMMGKLTDIYDGHPYSESRRSGDGKNTFTVQRPQLNLLAGTTPGQLHSGMPEGIWSHGFMSRVILVFSSEMRKQSLFAEVENNEAMLADLKEDLRGIAALTGRMKFTQEAAEAIDAWQMADCVPQPTHPKLFNYNTRRTAHMLKLMMVASASRSDELIIEEDDFNTALGWLIEAEEYMPEIFRSMAAENSDNKVIEDVWHLVHSWGIKKKGEGLPKTAVMRFLQNKVPSYQIETIIRTMTESEMLKSKHVSGKGIVYTIGSAAFNEY
jgi:predicted transcriptional regulator